ncbi:HAD family hydrolase [Hymenobacter setariae]|uniref:HAD family hydrolase n=1 Tax=Hymenobacter setariae TaxID=2594794 RepID=A0A558C4A4_9BACT|nr:HAD family hydrolase [Hymenobacter setariae]TVT43472.1 HAD family hydrolase [Hymenobacter setariae]
MALALELDWTKVKAVIFDVDGTLYAQSKLRRRMLYDLLGYYALRPWRLQEMLLLRRFRAEREKRPGHQGPNLESAQYAWCADNSQFSVAQVRAVVGRWMFSHPNQYLGRCAYPGTRAFFDALRQQDIKIGIYSDYPAHDKLVVLGLPADVVVSSTDPDIDQLKPNPKGLLHIAAALGLATTDCLFIGDRPELDGECAERAGMPYLIVPRQAFDQFTFYHDLVRALTAAPAPATLSSL